MPVPVFMLLRSTALMSAIAGATLLVLSEISRHDYSGNFFQARVLDSRL
ncbi:MAG: hypothetical protein V7L01_33050 [Nostoc sp.]